MRKETSLFHNYGSFVEAPLNKESVVPWDENATDGTAEYGKILLIIIHRYKVINRQGILRCLQTKKANDWKKDMLSKTLKALRKAGLIRMYEMENRNPDEQVLTIYAITEVGGKVINKKVVETEITDLIKDTRRCLDRLSLNQWHTNIRYLIREREIKSVYDQFVIKEGEIVPSFIRYERVPDAYEEYMRQQAFSLFTYVAPHREEELEGFYLKLIHTYEFLLENPQYRPAIIVILCENMNHASWMSWKMNQIREMRPLNAFIYALDIITSREQMLSLLYTCDADEEGMVRSNINLT